MEQLIRFDNPLGESLAGTLHDPGAATGAGVVLGHCFTCSRHTAVLREIARGLEDAGIAALRFDFSGNGQSEGVFSQSTYSKQIAEMKTAADFLRSRGIGRIGLAGHSLGAVVALLAAAELPQVVCVCALAGRLSGLTALDFLDQRQKEQVRRTGRVPFTSRGRQLEITEDFFSDADRYRPAERIAALKVPLLVVHGDRDEIIPVAEARRAHEINPAGVRLAVVTGADHMFGQETHRREVAHLVVNWFSRQFGYDSGAPAPIDFAKDR